MTEVIEQQYLDIIYECGPVAQRFHADTVSRVKLLIGPFGTGKTSSGAYDIIELQSERVIPINGVKKSRFAVVRNTYPELKDTTIKTYFDWFPEHAFGKYNKTDKLYKIFVTGEGGDREIEILFRALDNPDDVKNLLSLELTGAHVDESREIHDDIIKHLLGRIGRYPSLKDTKGKNPFVTQPQIDLTSNYPSTEHWMYRDFVKNPVDGYSIYQQAQEENKHNLRPGYYETLEVDFASRPDLLRTLVRGTWGVTVRGKQVYTEFNRDIHVAKYPLIPTEATQVIRGWDNTGLSPAISLSYINTLGQWCIFKEFCFEDTGIEDATEAVIIWMNTNLHEKCTFTDYGDPAGKSRGPNKKSPADYIYEMSNVYGKNIRIEDGIQTFKIRREAVAGRLIKLINGLPAMLIDPNCTRLIDGFEGGYAYPEIANSGVFKDEPAKNGYSHIHDSIQYPATRLFKVKPDKPIPPPPPLPSGPDAWMV